MKQFCFRTVGATLIVFVLTFGVTVAQTNEHGLDRANFDTTISPCTDFYQFANGSWLKNNPIPAQYGTWGAGHEVYERNIALLRSILEEAATTAGASKGSITQKLGDFYSTAMDSARIEADAAKPLQAEFAALDALKTGQDIQKLVAGYHAGGQTFLFGIGSDQDMKNSTEVIAYATQGGLGLPDRDYYTRDDDESKQLREKYVAHVSKMLQLLGDSPADAAAHAERIMVLETRLAKASLTNVEQRDPNSWYNMVSVVDADKATPHFAWSYYFSTIGLPEVQKFSFAHPKFFAAMDSLITELPIDDWKQYFRWHLVHDAAPQLSSDFVNENFAFYGTALAGTKELRPRWKRVLTAADNTLGEALGQAYVAKAFPPKSKARAIEMVNNLREALKARIQALDWMSDSTKALAQKKLAAFTAKIGYPEKWRDYSGLEIDKSSYYANMRRGEAFELHRQIAKIGKPVDRTEWGMTPQTVNAYYNPLMNEIVFPAGILQPPMFDGEVDDAVNYGAMGSVIGHEMTHGFDDQGSQFDAEGNLKNWWTEKDLAEFKNRTQRLVAQYGAYVAIDSLHVNGELTLGENIADLGGVLIAYDALKMALKGKPVEKIDGFTPQQRFFLSFAQSWRENYRPESLKLQVNTDPHSPTNFRTDGPLYNVPAFKEAFDCEAGSKMVNADLVNIW
ncbi:MAG: M13 family metallopeptidase [Candidatus Zixiibacteriota bacterium]